MKILNEVYRYGLDKEENFELKELDYYSDSFIAFQILIDIKEDGIFNLGNNFEYTPEKLDNYFIEINENAKLYFIESLNTEKGMMADILSDKINKKVSKKDRINIFVYIDKLSFLKNNLEIKLCKSKFIRERNLLEKISISINDCGKLGTTKIKNLELWQHPSTLARHYNLDIYSEEFFDILENYINSLSKLGVKSVTTILSDAPWNGQIPLTNENAISNLYENNMLKIKTSPFEIDFSFLDKYIDLCFKYGIDKEIDIFGLIGVWTYEQPFLASEDRMLTSEEIELYRDLVYQHFIDKGYIDKAFICIDEPKDIEKIKKEINYIRERYPRFKIKCAFDKEEIANEIAPLVDNISVSFFLASKGYNADSWYICCGPETPNSFVSSELIEIRSLAYLSKKFGIKNILRWSYMAFTKDPNKDAVFGNFRAGDTYLIYPNSKGKVNLSLRYIQFLRLIEEISLLEDDEYVYKKVFNIENMKDVLLENYQVKEEFLNRDYEFYRSLRRELSKNKNGYK